MPKSWQDAADEPVAGPVEPGGRARVPVLVCIDVEPDYRLIDRSRVRAWGGFEQVADRLEVARPGLAERTGEPANYTWFIRMDPQVAETQGTPTWPATAYAARFDRLRREGDELGLHTHAYRSTPEGGWVVDDVDQGWVEYVVRSAHEAFRESFGSGCRCFRFGDRWINDATLDLIEELGIQYDVTLEPGRHPVAGATRIVPTLGPSADFSTVPHAHYRRDATDFRRCDPAGRSGLLIVPLSTLRHGRLARTALTLLRRVTHPSLRPEPVETLNLALRPVAFRWVLDRTLHRPDRPYVALLVRSEPSTRALGWIERNLRTLVEHPEVGRMVVTTVPRGMSLLGAWPASRSTVAVPETGSQAPRTS